MTPHLSVLRDSELLYERGIFPQATYIFRHSLTQEVAYDSLLQKKKQEIHERIGQAIEELYAERLEEFYEILAYHYSRSEDNEKAYRYLSLSANKASLRYSNWEAFRLYKMAIDVLNKLPDTEENKKRGIEVCLLMQLPMMALVFPENSLQILEEGEKLSKELDDEGSLAKLYSIIGLYYSFKGDSLQALKYSERAFREAEKIQNIQIMAPTATSLCISYIVTGDYPRVVEVASSVIPLLESTHRESDSFGRGINVYSQLVASYGLAMGFVGHFDQASFHLDKALRFAVDVNDRFVIAIAEEFYGFLLYVQGKMDECVRRLEAAITNAEEAQVMVNLGPTWVMLGAAYLALGDLDTCRRCAEKGLQIQLDTGFSVSTAMCYEILATHSLYVGDLENARSYADEALKLAVRGNEQLMEGMQRLLQGRILRREGKSRYSKAEEYILQGIQLLERLELKPYYTRGYLYLGELYADMGQKEKAMEILKKAEGMMQEMGMDYWLRAGGSIRGKT
jgi:tetratricopeptide (TPR) repeat protein